LYLEGDWIFAGLLHEDDLRNTRSYLYEDAEYFGRPPAVPSRFIRLVPDCVSSNNAQGFETVQSIDYGLTLDRIVWLYAKLVLPSHQCPLGFLYLNTSSMVTKPSA